MINPGALSCGLNGGAPVISSYKSPFKFTGELKYVTVDLSGDLIEDTEAQLKAAMARQ